MVTRVTPSPASVHVNLGSEVKGVIVVNLDSGDSHVLKMDVRDAHVSHKVLVQFNGVLTF